jgi:hypothetical protein
MIVTRIKSISKKTSLVLRRYLNVVVGEYSTRVVGKVRFISKKIIIISANIISE